MKHGIILQATNENTQDEITYALYEYLRGDEENKDVKFISAGLITIEGERPIYRNPVEILRCIQEFLENHPDYDKEITTLNLVKIEEYTDVKQLIASEAYKDAEEERKINDMLFKRVNEYWTRYHVYIHDKDYTSLLKKLEGNSFTTCTYEPDNKCSVEKFVLFRDDITKINVSIECISHVYDPNITYEYQMFRSIPVCFRVKAEHLPSGKHLTQTLWGVDDLEE